MTLIPISESSRLIESRLDTPPTVWEARKARLKRYQLPLCILAGGITVAVVMQLMVFTAKKLTPHSDHKTINKISDVALFVLLAVGGASFCLAIAAIAVLRYRNPLYFSHKALAVNSHEKSVNRVVALPIIQTIMKKWEHSEHFIAWKERQLRENSDVNIEDLLLNMVGSGHCAGHALTLLNLMAAYPHFSSEGLLEFVKVERVIYLQLLSNIIHSNILAKEPFEKIAPLDVLRKEALILSVLHCRHYPTALRGLNVMGSPYIEVNEGHQVIEKIFHESYAQLAPSPEATVAGIIILHPTELSHPIAHALFFQCDKHKFRFYDYSSALSGFYEFSNASELFKALVIHIKTRNTYADGKILFIIHAFPLESSQNLSIV